MEKEWELMVGALEKSIKNQDIEEVKGCPEQENEQIIKKH